MPKINARILSPYLAVFAAFVLWKPSVAQTAFTFPDTATLIARVAEHQKEIESLLNQYTFTDKDTLCMLDKKGSIHSQHSDTYYVTPTPYEVFTLHVSHDGSTVSQHDLERQEKEIQNKLRNDERRARKDGNVHPNATLLFADIILKSQFTPLRWQDMNGTPVVVYAFEPRNKPSHHGSADEKISGDMRGTMWVLPEEAEIVRMEFTSVAPVGLNWVTNVKNFQGFIEQRKVNDEAWLPSHQEFTAQGRELLMGYRIRQISEFSDYLKATTDVLQQLHTLHGDTANHAKL